MYVALVDDMVRLSRTMRMRTRKMTSKLTVSVPIGGIGFKKFPSTSELNSKECVYDSTCSLLTNNSTKHKYHV